ncbi:zinc-binding dehydrogenase [Sphingomonas sp.]|uniref:zinc-binding dehydrogenase n=1 Tax=Sphingomonas sp. TaxID=28214 RepID=UPI001EBE643D|nr:zinc-binding dehydrogenase [Sphingomonas sp.]MBX3594173.1 zinc-binding dehydrogenase [Sphingomonas sp.]
MPDPLPATERQLVSTATEDGAIEVTLRELPVPTPSGDEVLIRIEATPINPSDLGVMFSVADTGELSSLGYGARAPIPQALRRHVAPRLGKPLPIGNEGAGTVVAAGNAPAAQAMIGKTVAIAGGGCYTQYRLARAQECLVLPDGVSAEEGASSFVNPMTALAMVGTMRRDGYRGIVHTAAASNLGQMLVKLTASEGVPLVNIVRSAAQADLLRGIGATHVLDSSAPDFLPALIDAIAETQAYLAFDAIGGGRLAGQILSAMEAAAVRTNPASGPYGSTTMKHVHIYGSLNTAPTEVTRNFGFAWGMGGWLLTPYLQQAGMEEVMRMRARVGAEIRTTFASRYTRRISLEDAVQPDIIAGYVRRATGEKYLILPQL